MCKYEKDPASIAEDSIINKLAKFRPCKQSKYKSLHYIIIIIMQSYLKLLNF